MMEIRKENENEIIPNSNRAGNDESFKIR